MSVGIGDPAPNFSAPSDGGGKLALAKLKGQNVILYFYPKDDTSGCTKEACGFRDALSKFGKANAVVLGVSRDSVASHDKFKAKYKLPFALLSDEDGKHLRGLRHLGREKHVRAQIHGHRALDLPHRQGRQDSRRLAQGENPRPRRGGATRRSRRCEREYVSRRAAPSP